MIINALKKVLLALSLTVLTVVTAAAAPDLDTKVTVNYQSAPWRPCLLRYRSRPA